jgi:hypothetical protein
MENGVLQVAQASVVAMQARVVRCGSHKRQVWSAAVADASTAPNG